MNDYSAYLAAFLSPLQYVDTGDKVEGRHLYALTEAICFEDGELEVNVPVGFVTDLASVPWIFRWLIPVNGRHAKAAVVHDYLYEYARMKLISRKRCDDAFLSAMVQLDVNYFKRLAMYYAVRLFGWMGFAERPHLVLPS